MEQRLIRIRGRGRPPRSMLAGAFGLLVAASIGIDSSAHATVPLTVAVGTLSADAAGAPELEAELRQALETAIDALPHVRRASPRRAQLIVEGSLVRVERAAGQARSEVSLMVSERRSGTLRLLLGGHAAARGGADPVPASIAGAVRSALRPLADPARSPLTPR